MDGLSHFQIFILLFGSGVGMAGITAIFKTWRTILDVKVLKKDVETIKKELPLLMPFEQHTSHCTASLGGLQKTIDNNHTVQMKYMQGMDEKREAAANIIHEVKGKVELIEKRLNGK